METLRIRYTSTEDQVSVAYLDAGAGYPILHMPYPMNHLQLQWGHPIFRASQEALAERYRLVAFDGRGQGLSDKDVADFSLDGLVKDAEAVGAATGLERFAIFCGFATPAALTYAAKHPEQVSHLVLWCPMQRSNIVQGEELRLDTAHRLLAAIDWDFYLETLTFWLGFGEDADGRALHEYLREGVDPLAYAQIMGGIGDYDPEASMPETMPPTLICQPRQGRLTDLAGARRLAAGMDAELAVFEGRISIPNGVGLESVDRFLDATPASEPEAAAEPTPARTGGLHTIFFSDVVGVQA